MNASDPIKIIKKFLQGGAVHIWVLDVTFREDECRVRDRIAVQNMALLRKIALNLVRSDKSSRASL